MKRIFIIILILSIASISFAKGNKKIKYLKPRCIMGYLYYDWVGRPKYVSIPVLNDKGNIVKCSNECQY